MAEKIKSLVEKIEKSRLLVLSLVILILFGILFHRIFTLQIINGQEYADKYTLTIEKERTSKGIRGNIYDRNGKLLAYNELSYTVTLEDNQTYDNDKIKNSKLNAMIHKVIQMIESNGDVLTNEFPILYNKQGKFEFNLKGNALMRFRADIFGYSTIEELKKNKNNLGFQEAEATEEQIIDFLRSDKKFGIRVKDVDLPTKNDEKYGQQFYSLEDAYKILVIRYALNQNYFQKYIYTTIASGVSDETVAMIKENADILKGIDIVQDTVRKYVDSKYFSHIIGYIGKISQEEYDELVVTDESYNLTDVIGKAGIEKEMEEVLHGSKGYEKFYVDNMGRVVERSEYVEALSGNDVYLSIDSDLQVAVYDLLEQHIAGIVYSKIENIKEHEIENRSSASDIIIPIDDVYFALINNNVINIDLFSLEDASETEKKVYQIFQNRQTGVLEEIRRQMTAEFPISYENLKEEMQVYMSYILSMLTENEILIKSSIDTEDEVQQQWNNKQISLSQYLQHAIAKEWIDITGFRIDSKYSDSTEIYEALLNYIQEQLKSDKNFHKKLYQYMIRGDMISGSQICLLLFEQEILEKDQGDYFALEHGTLSGYEFMREKIKNLEITPAQLALDPCTGSSVVIHPQTGETLACVSYPGYDTNRLANTMDTMYYNNLRTDLTSPLYNNATQQQTAPGSTFKPVTTAAALTEGIISTDTIIEDKGVFELVQDGPRCWIYPGGTHGKIHVAEAIRDSCNYFFYTLGYNMSLTDEIYQEQKGIQTLEKYATLFGLGEKTGIEIPESEPQISNEYPIPSAIGQGNHNFTTIGLARYAAAIASSGKVYKLTLLDKVTDSDGNTIEDYSPQIKDNMEEISSETWLTIQQGMKMMAENNDSFKDLGNVLTVAGKTGTAQQIRTRPNHALFIGYAPYQNPTLAIATRIAYGYTSANAAEVSRHIMEYYFNITDEEELMDGRAQEIEDSDNSFTD